MWWDIILNKICVRWGWGTARKGGTINAVYDEYKFYLGHFFTNDLRDDKDIQRQCHKLYGQGNMLIRKFNMCTVDVKLSLFRTFCTQLYTAQLWWNHFDYSLNKLKVVYNDIMHILLRLPRSHSASEIFVNINVPTCQDLVRNLIFKFMNDLEINTNVIIRGLVCPSVSDVISKSKIWTHWYRLLYVHYDKGWIQLLDNFWLKSVLLCSY